MFLRLPALPDYYRQHMSILAQAAPENYQAQMEQLQASAKQRSRLARGEPAISMPADSVSVATLEKPHRRGLYIVGIISKAKDGMFCLFRGSGNHGAESHGLDDRNPSIACPCYRLTVRFCMCILWTRTMPKP